MSLLQFIPIRYVLALILGILLGDSFQWNIKTGLLLAGIPFLPLVVLYAKKLRTRDLIFEICTAICIMGIGVCAIAGTYGPQQKHHYSHVKADSITTRIRIREELRSGPFNNRYIGQVVAVNGIKKKGKLLLYVPDSIRFNADAEIFALKSWQPIRSPRNPGEFNYKRYMKYQGVYDEIRMKQADFLPIPQSNHTLLGRIHLFRQKIREALLNTDLDPRSVATMEALLLGQRLHLDANLYDAYKDAGAVHILAVSGLHIGILLIVFKFVLQPLRFLPYGRRWQFLGTLLLLWAYALFTGMSPSVVRAVTLFSFLSYAWILNRPSNMYNTLAISFFFVLLVLKPGFLFQAGFHMSYAAVLSIMWLYPKISPLWQPKPKPLKKAWDLLAVSLAAQAGVFPISLYYFHQFPGLFFISNLIILPFLALILSLGIFMILLAVMEWKNNFLTIGYDTLLRSMNSAVEWIGSQESFIFRNIPLDGVHMFLLYGVLIAGILYLEKRRFAQLIQLGIAILLVQVWSGYIRWEAQNKTELILFHSFSNSLFLERNGQSIRGYTQNGNLSNNRPVRDYSIQERTGMAIIKKMHHAYYWGEAKILILDDSGIYPSSDSWFTHIVLTQSPKIHLGRLLDRFPQAVILADGSNYPSFVTRWKKTCEEKKRLFHYTGEKGAYRF